MPNPLAEQLRSIAPTVSVGVLTADLMALGADVRRVEEAGVRILHFDVMDGCFCPMLTVGPAFIRAVKTPLFKDVHLMIEEPLDKLEPYVAAGADMITVHIEACRHPHRVLQALGRMTNANDAARGLLRGIALNPGTPLEGVEPLLDELDMIVLLAVNPGWGGQKFIGAVRRKMDRLIELLYKEKRDILVGLDGGITRDNIAEAARMRADIIVTGSAVFDGKAPAENARFMMAELAAARKGM